LEDLAAFYRHKGYTILVEQLPMSEEYEGIAYKYSHNNPECVITGDSWFGVCNELEAWVEHNGR
jgi:hypothetical protein